MNDWLIKGDRGEQVPSHIFLINRWAYGEFGESFGGGGTLYGALESILG